MRAYKPVHHALTRAGTVVVIDRHPALVLRNKLNKALYQRVFRDPGVVFAPQEAGFSLAVHLDDRAAAEMVLEGRYSPDETRVLASLMDASDDFVDVGANYGYFSLLAATRKGPSISVVALEPNPRLAELITRSAEHNGLRNVTVRSVAAGAARGEAQLRVDIHSSATSALVADADQAVFVEVVTIDDVLISRRPGRRVLIKVDVEGHEGEVVAGARRTLSQGAVLACEVFAPAANALLTQMRELGYQAFRHNGQPLGREDFLRHRRLDLVFLPDSEVPSWTVSRK